MTREESQYSRDTILRLARAGVWVRLVVQDDACPACTAHKDRLYPPDQAPRIPIPECTSAFCRCRFEAVDPSSKLAVSEMVARGAQLVRARLKRGALSVLRRAVALDELYEPGWLWLSAVVDDQEKVQCLEKVLQINPDNHWARKKLYEVQRRLGIVVKSRGTAPLVDIPLEVLQIRAERQVIIEQWQSFMDIIAQTAPKIARDQALAFTRRLEQANAEAVEQLVTVAALRDEMEQQWRELDVVGRSLGQAIRDFAYQPDYHADEKQMREVLQFLFDALMTRRKEMKKQVELYGGTAT
ncbi:MAG: hypothetical protein JW934_13540 [Anaerolineae bacterium]|nr:hypothetical protein [Anaerolineae bacterium]